MTHSKKCTELEHNMGTHESFLDELENTKEPIPLGLTTLDGNAFALMGTFQKHAKKSGWDSEEINAVLDECRSSDYNHLVHTIQRFVC